MPPGGGQSTAWLLTAWMPAVRLVDVLPDAGLLPWALLLRTDLALDLDPSLRSAVSRRVFAYCAGGPA
jgi:hypothetical protein